MRSSYIFVENTSDDLKKKVLTFFKLYLVQNKLHFVEMMIVYAL